MSKRRARTGTDSIPQRLAALGYGSYRDYLASEHWRNVRRRFFASKMISLLDGRPCCVACHKSNVRLSVHHRTYKRLGAERLMDLVAVCDDCHELIHKYGPSDLWGVTQRVIKMRGRRLLSFSTGRVVARGPNDGIPPWE